MTIGKPFEKGNKGKPKGAKNKVTKISQEAIATALEGSAEEIKKALDKLKSDPYAYLNTIVKLLPFVVPKKTDITTDGQKITRPPIKLGDLTDEELELLDRITKRMDSSGEV